MNNGKGLNMKRDISEAPTLL